MNFGRLISYAFGSTALSLAHLIVPAIPSLCAILIHTPTAGGGTVLVENVGGETQLKSVDLNDARGTILMDGLIRTIMFHYTANPSDTNPSTSTNTVLSPKNPNMIPTAERHKLLDEDKALNTGIINLGAQSPMAVGQSPSSGSVGLGIRFLSPIINGLGDDIVFFEYADGNLVADPVVITGLTGGEGATNTNYAANSHATISTTISNYPLTISNISTNDNSVASSKLYRQSNPVSSLTHLEQKVLTPNGFPGSGARVFGFSLDLTLLGVLPNDTVTGLFIQSSVEASTFVDPVFIAGLHPIAEPSSTSLVLLATLTLAPYCRKRMSGIEPRVSASRS